MPRVTYILTVNLFGFKIAFNKSDKKSSSFLLYYYGSGKVLVMIISSSLQVFLVKVAPKLRSKFTGGHSCLSVISILICNFVEITLPHWCSPVNWLYIFGTPFPKNTQERLLLNGSCTATWIFLLCVFFISCDDLMLVDRNFIKY